jgi:hypothetical protein
MNAVYGVAWFAGSVLLGVLYDLSLVAVDLEHLIDRFAVTASSSSAALNRRCCTRLAAGIRMTRPAWSGCAA